MAQVIPINQPKLITSEKNDQNQKLGSNIHCSLLDKTGNLWFGTTGDGVYRFDGSSFVNFNTKNGLNDNCVWSILEDRNGLIWFSTEAGICSYDGSTINNTPIMTENNASLKRGPCSMLQDKNGLIWFGTSTGVYLYDGKSLTPFLDHNIINQSGLQLKKVGHMLEDRAGDIWFGSDMGGGEGISLYDGKSITNFKPNGDVWILSITEDKTGNIWFSGRSHGNFRYDGNTFTDFTKIDSTQKKQVEKICLTGNVADGPILTDKSGNVWFTGKMTRFGGTGGIWRYDGKTCTNFTDAMLANYAIWSMVEDNDGNIWIGTTNTSLFRFDGTKFTCFSE